jgi:undecaprenyl-phosphate 4-deoxy-4-formamido-L-arabinose transferase
VSPSISLSIVIPVYNGAASIADLVRALENLPIAGGHEIVLVNDGSADDSLAVCRTLFDRAFGSHPCARFLQREQ